MSRGGTPPASHSSWLWEGATPPHPLTPGSGACLPGRERGVCGWPEPAAWNAGGPCPEPLSHPEEKQAHLHKPRGARWGLGTGQPGGASRSAFLLSRPGEPGQRGLRARPSLRGASRRGLGGRGLGSTWRKEAAGDRAAQRTGWEGAWCRGSGHPSTPAPPDFRASWRPPGVPRPGPQFPPLCSRGRAWPGMLSGGEGVPAAQSEPGRGAWRARSSSIPEYQ